MPGDRTILRQRVLSALRKPPVLKVSIRTRLLRQSVALTMVTVATLAVLSTVVVRSLLTFRAFDQLSAIAAANETLLTEALNGHRERAILFASQENIKTAFRTGVFTEVTAMFERMRVDGMPVLGLAASTPDDERTVQLGDAIPNLRSTLAYPHVEPFIDRKAGWTALDVYIPIRSSDNRMLGTLAIRYDVSGLLSLLSSTKSFGESARLWLTQEQGGEVVIVYESGDEPLRTTRLGSLDDPYVASLPLALSLEKGGVIEHYDEHGKPSLAAYRFVPSIGWGLTVSVGSAAAFKGLAAFSGLLLLLGCMLIACSALFSLLLSRKLTSPLLQLASSMQQLRPGKWTLKKSAHTGDEVEILNHVASELTSRLQATYDHLEEEVAKRTEDLKRQYLLDRTILENVEYGIFVFGQDGTLTMLNPSAEAMIKRGLNDAVGQSADKLLAFFLNGKRMAAAAHPVRRCLKERRTVRLQGGKHLMLRPGAPLLPVALSASPLLRGNRLTGVLLLVQDLTEAQELECMKSDFITLASHQLRTPLSSLRWYAELLKGESISKKSQEYITQLQTSADKMAAQLDELLQVTHLESGDIRPLPQQTDLAALLHEVSEEWRTSAEAKGVQWHARLPKHPVRTSTDAGLLRLALNNICSNALRYSRRGKAVSLALTHERGHAIITVSDQGMGIPDDAKPHVFEKFFRATNARKANADGTGLGLYLTRAIVQALKGGISFVTELGKGTTFTVRLPV